MSKVFMISNSPRRKSLCSTFFPGLIKVIPNHFNEPKLTHGDLIEKLKTIALLKAIAAPEKYGPILIAADTVVLFGSRIMGKPLNAKDAHKMLSLISGKKVRVITALAVIDRRTNKSICETESSFVQMDKISKQDIASYIATKEPLDKAGAFAVQGKGAFFIKKITGDYFNIVGLPVFRLNNILKRMGIKTL